MFLKTPKKLTGLLATAVIMVGCENAEPPGAAPLRSVRHIEVLAGGADRVRTFTGVSKSEQEAKLSFKVSGTLTTLAVSVGDTVDSGQVIAEIDASSYQLQLQQSQADLTRYNSEQRNADAAYRRTRELYENQNTSKNDLDAARTAFESTKALVNSSLRAVDLAQLNVNYTRLVSKDACSVASTSADVGENVTVGQEIVLVNCGDKIKVEVSVPENLVSSLESGSKASVDFDSVSGTQYQGVVTEIGVAGVGTTFPVSVQLTDSTGLRAGLAAQVSFRFATTTSFPVVPVTAVSEDHNGRYVYLLTPGSSPELGLVKRQNVEVAGIVSDGIEVASGINPGDKVVTAGVTVIYDGLEVKVD